MLGPSHGQYKHHFQDEDYHTHIKICLIASEITAFNQNLYSTQGKNGTCHFVARAFAKALNLTYRDGVFIGTKPHSPILHSWLETKNNTIIDLCPIGQISSPIMLVKEGHYAFLHSRYMIPPEPLDEIVAITKQPWFQLKVDALTNHILNCPELQDFIKIEGTQHPEATETA